MYLFLGKSEKEFELGSFSIKSLFNKFISNQEEVKEEEIKTNHDDVILHIHGGGFIAMSSKSHQIYSRVLARDTNLPIFSIDYRLSPDHKYPDALEDWWNVYSWLVKYCKINLNINASKIILMGDSAGGNLAASLTILAIQNNFVLPHKLILVYPALSLSKSQVFPSVSRIILNFRYFIL